MKKTLLLAILIATTIQFSFAQSTIAKLKFEEAEEAYANKNFELTLTKLKEVEVLLKSTNPKILYLQILAQVKIIEKKPLNDYSIIHTTKTSIEKYLKDYENLPDNEDKYREIYKTSENYKKYLITRQEFDQLNQQLEADKAAKREAERDKLKHYNDNFMKYLYFQYKVGISVEDMKIQYPDLGLRYANNKTQTRGLEELISLNKDYRFYVKNDTVIGYLGKISTGTKKAGSSYGDGAEYAEGDKQVAEIKKNLETAFNFSPLIEKTGSSYETGKQTSYSWIKNGKTISLIIVYKETMGMFNAIFSYNISISSIDQNLAK